MKKNTVYFIALLLILYSIVLVVLEFRGGEGAVRRYFSDISDSSRFFAVNTTLSVFFTWICAVIAGLMLSMVDKDSERQEYLFLVSQVLLFFVLGIDDRFQIHEGIENRLQIDEAFIYFGYGFLELASLYFLGNLRTLRTILPRPNIYLIVAGGFFFIMTVIDTFIPDEAVLRLSIEDLSKTWAGFFLVLFFWGRFSDRVALLKRKT